MILSTHGTGTTAGATDGHGDHGTAGMAASGATPTHTTGHTGDGVHAGMRLCTVWSTTAIPSLANTTPHADTWLPTTPSARRLSVATAQPVPAPDAPPHAPLSLPDAPPLDEDSVQTPTPAMSTSAADALTLPPHVVRNHTRDSAQAQPPEHKSAEPDSPYAHSQTRTAAAGWGAHAPTASRHRPHHALRHAQAALLHAVPLILIAHPHAARLLAIALLHAARLLASAEAAHAAAVAVVAHAEAAAGADDLMGAMLPVQELLASCP